MRDFEYSRSLYGKRRARPRPTDGCHAGLTRLGPAIRACVWVMGTVASVLLLASLAYGQPEKEPEPGKEKDAPFEVPQSPEEKKALEESSGDGQEKEGQYDLVVLKDNTKIRGRVVDPGGPAIRVEQKLGAVSILKSQIKELHLASDPDAGEGGEDVVHLRTGGEIRGHAQISKDGKNLTVTIRENGREHTVTFPYVDVIKIEYAKDRKERLRKQIKALQDPLSGKIKSMLEELSSTDEAVWQAAKKKLVALGVFAIDNLKEVLAELEEPTASRVKQVLKTNELKSYISGEAARRFTRLERVDIYELLVTAKDKEKLKALRRLALFEDDGAVPLLSYMAKHKDESAEVRNFCLHSLAKADRNVELLRLMAQAPKDEGWLRVACALYLADNGIYAGAPHFVSALRHRDPGMRRLAAERLRQASGKNFAFKPDGTEEEREAPIKKWETWWDQHSAEILRQSAKVLGEVGDDDRSFSQIYQKRGHTSWGKGKPQEAAENFRRALELDPSNLGARLSLVVVLYTELGKKDDARRELKLILKRYGEQAGPMVRKLAFYHTALLDLSEGKWKGALHNLQAAIALDGRFADGYIALGKTYYIQIVNDDQIARERLILLPENERDVFERQRRTVIECSVRALEIGLGLLDQDIRSYTSIDFRKRRRRVEREDREHLGAKAEGLTQVQSEAAFKDMLLRKKARVCAMLADSYAMGLEWRRAAEVLRYATRLAPDKPEYLCSLGSALAAGGRREEAREAFERCLKIDPKNKAAIRGLKDLK